MTAATVAATARLRALALRVQLPGFTGTTLDGPTRSLLAEGLGGVCLFASNTADGLPAVAALVSSIRAAAPGAVVAVDEEGGDVTRLHASTGSPYPGHAVLGAADDLGWTRQVGREIGSSLAFLGISLVLGPVADVNSNPDNPVIGVRSMGASTSLVARHVAAWVAGVQESGVAACAKHFPGHGDTHVDSHLGLPSIDNSRLDLVPFASAVRAGVSAVMTGHLVVPGLDGELPAALSPAAHALLREELGFTGAVVTDALDMAGASAERGIPEAAVLALVAGADLLCLGQETGHELVREVQGAIVQAVEAERLTVARLEEAAGRVVGLASSHSSLVAGIDHVSRVRRALRVDGAPPRLEGASTVRVETPPSIAVGPVPWGLPAQHVVRPGDDLAAAVAALPPGPVVLQVRDAHRHGFVLALVASVAARGPVLVVEWGWPGPWELPVPRVCAYGSSLPGHEAVGALLREHGWQR